MLSSGLAASLFSPLVPVLGALMAAAVVSGRRPAPRRPGVANTLSGGTTR
jgi:hypothetical protein